MNAIKQRLDYIDEMKGFAILLVTMGHVYLPYTQESHNHPIAQMICSFHMAFFYFLSGFMLAKTHKIDCIGIRGFILKKLQTLILPWLSFSFIVAFFLQKGIGDVFDIAKLNFYPVSGYWFLPLLFIFMVAWLIVECAVSRVLKLIYVNLWSKTFAAQILANAFVVCITVATGYVLHLYHVIIYAIYYVVFIGGFFVSKEEKVASMIMRLQVYGISALILVIFWKLGPIDTYGGVAWRSMFNLCHTFVCSVTACVVFFNLFLKIQLPRIVRRYLQETGKMSLAIYLLPVVLLPSGFLFPDSWTPAFTNIIILFISVFINIIRYWVGRIILEIPYLRFILFGKR